MAKPVIYPYQGVPETVQFVAIGFQPAASNTPTGWRATTLPPGITIDATTGLVSGTPTLAGYYVFDVYAHNADGESDKATFVMGVEASAPSSGIDIDVTLDAISGVVTLRRAAALASAATPAAPAPTAADTGKPTKVQLLAAARASALHRTKQGNDVIYGIKLVKDGAPVIEAVTGVTTTLKEWDTDDVLVTSDDFATVGSGANAVQRSHITLADDALTGALGNYEKQTGTEFVARMEIEVEMTNPDYDGGSGFGPATLRLASSTFFVILARPQKALS